MKTILVAGDVIWDYNLVQHPKAPSYHHAPLPSMVLYQQAGGAWFLEDLIRWTCEDLDVQIHGAQRQAVGSVGDNSRINQAYQIWSQQKQGPGAKGDRNVWRISQFLGCQTADPKKTSPVRLPPDDDLLNSDILVLDDLCLGFREQNDQWPSALKEGSGPGHIVLKISSADLENPLWSWLEKRFADRLTVVLPVVALRDRGADISQALSWDRTIEEIAREFDEGASSQDLARCRRVIVCFGACGVASFTRCRLKFGPGRMSLQDGETTGAQQSDALVYKQAKFERFLYDPEHLEGTWKAQFHGHVFGALSILTAAMARHELLDQDYPLFIALGRALSAMRASLQMGADLPSGSSMENVCTTIASILRWKKGAANSLSGQGGEPASAFYTAYPRYDSDFAYGLALDQEGEKKLFPRSDLLRDLTGEGLDYAAAKAMEVVLHGPEQALRPAPKASYGRYLTVDREEIERINTIHNLILTYRDNPKLNKPLSIAVFGPPGSGKSFAISQLLSRIFENNEPLEFNLAQFHSPDDLYEAFHQVRDKSVQGQLPLVFWDEFDVDDLKWLKEFLAPMQQAKFVAKGLTHPLGRAIFMFAGGTCSRFQDFDKSDVGDEREEGRWFRSRKGPDFVSRLRGFVNVKGPDPVWEGSCRGPSATVHQRSSSADDLAAHDVPHLIRRGLLLRAALKKHWPHLIDSKSGTAAISSDVVHAFLRARKFHHGARSLDSIVSMSRLSSANRFAAVALPARDALELHVTEDFLDLVHAGQVEMSIIELLAEACHRAWMAQKIAHGWKYGKERNDQKKEHPLILPYEQLPEKDKEANRKTARLTQAKLHEIGYRIERRNAAVEVTSAIPKIENTMRQKLIRIEHDIWLRDHLLNGYEWAQNSNDDLRLHRDIALFDNVSPEDQILDQAIVDSITKVLEENGYTLASEQPAVPGPTAKRTTKKNSKKKRAS